jgi:hypothetical protein
MVALRSICYPQFDIPDASGKVRNRWSFVIAVDLVRIVGKPKSEIVKRRCR